MTFIFDWILQHWIETIAAVLGLVGVFLQIKQNHWYWLTSIIMVSMYIVVYYDSKFYADMSFMLYYLIISVYGWYFWIKNRNKTKTFEIETKKLSAKQWLYSILFAAGFFVFIFLILNYLTDSDIAVGDAFTTSLGIVATWLLARKILENWLFWIVVNIVATGLYIHKGLYPTVVLYSVLTVMAFVGYFNWKKALKHA